MPASSRAVVAQQRVLGIDPGLTRCGLACVDIDPRRRARLVEVDVEGARKVFRLIDALEDSDDVQNVYTSVDLSPEVAAEFAGDED